MFKSDLTRQRKQGNKTVYLLRILPIRELRELRELRRSTVLPILPNGMGWVVTARPPTTGRNAVSRWFDRELLVPCPAPLRRAAGR
jgi:hypothetical protein